MASDVKVSGPLFDGQADAAVKDWLTVTRKDLADRGAQILRTFPMDKTGRSRGGFASHIHVLQRGAMYEIPAPKERGVTWGPWLEGVTRRNESTRFKGYHLFRKTAQRLDKMARPYARDRLGRFIGRMGGHA